MEANPTRRNGMKPAQLRRATAELAFVRRRRELLFWTIGMILAAIVSAATAIAFVISLVHGAAVDNALMAMGAGIVGASACRRRISGAT